MEVTDVRETREGENAGTDPERLFWLGHLLPEEFKIPENKLLESNPQHNQPTFPPSFPCSQELPFVSKVFLKHVMSQELAPGSCHVS